MSRAFIKFITAAFFYIAFAVYLYQPYFKYFDRLQFLLVINVSLAALGCYVLSRRWMAAFGASFFAGAIYGFGPFLLGLGKFHPTAGFPAAMVPWMFCLAAMGPCGRWRLIRWPLVAVPFVAIVVFFQAAAYFRLFAIPMQVRLCAEDFIGFLAAGVSAKRGLILIGFYHVPIAALVMGFAMLVKARRFGVITIFFIGIILVFLGPVLSVSPVIWLAIPVLCCSVLIGEGMQGLVLASWADRKWVLLSTIVMLVLSIVTLLAATKFANIFAGLGLRYTKLFTEAAKMYILGAIAVTIVFFMARGKLRLTALRWAILCSATAIDIFFGAGFIVDTIF